MCSSKKPKLPQHRIALAHINGRPVLHHRSPPASPSPDSKKPTISTPSPPISPKTRSLKSPAVKNGSPKPAVNTKRSMSRTLSLPSSFSLSETTVTNSIKCGSVSSTALSLGHAGSIAAARKEEVAMKHEQRKSKIAHYGRVKSAKFDTKVVPIGPSSGFTPAASSRVDEKRCSFITPNSDPIFVAYHDEEWGVPVHDDQLLFELLVLTGAQVGSDWSSVLKKRQLFREVFAGFDAEIVAKFTEKKITSLSTEYGIDQGLIRGVVDNSRRILEVRREFGTFSEYLWRFVNKKPISTQFKRSQKIPVKTSKSEHISKDMVKRGFRGVGPTVIYSFMQASGLTNDHLVTCSRHVQCSLMAPSKQLLTHED